MRMKQWYWMSDAALDGEFCDRVVAAGEKLKRGEGKVARDPKGTVRKSEVGWFPRTEENGWLLEPLRELVDRANAELWGWDVDQVQSVQYTTYREGEYYGWHADQHAQPYDDRRWPGKVRKLSVTAQLSDGDEYEGGDFEVEVPQRTPDRAAERIKVVDGLRPRGSVLVFPAFLFHRVTPVTRGVRHSLVAWYLGRPFV